MSAVTRFVGWAIVIYLLVAWPYAAAAQSDSEPQTVTLASSTDLGHFHAQLDAGEFSPALRFAREQKDEQLCDALLQKVALAQAGAGAGNYALATVANIESDLARAGVLRELSSSHSPLPSGQHGGTQADFDSLIDLIVTTIAPDTWEDVGGPGTIQEFPTGVYVDPQGVFTRVQKEDSIGALAVIKQQNANRHTSDDAFRPSALRKVSLPALEKHVQLRLAAGKPIDDIAMVMAGLTSIRYVFSYPETGDLVIAGPAGGWTIDGEGRAVSMETGEPVLRLDDFVVLLRHALNGKADVFGCAITPTDDGLTNVKEYIDRTSNHKLPPGGRTRWLNDLKSNLGLQRVDVFGIDPRTRVAQTMVEADYHMKLIGMGLEDGLPDVPSYLNRIRVPPGGTPPMLEVLRWWFTLDFDEVRSTADGTVFELVGQGVRLRSENELLDDVGRRVHTGLSEPLNREFAADFTRHFERIAEKYAVYSELRNVFRLAMVAALIQSHSLHDKVGWHCTCFGDTSEYVVPLERAPRWVESVINHRVVNRVQIIAGVSGGVSARPLEAISEKTTIQNRVAMGLDRAVGTKSRRADLPGESAWWWD